MMPLFAAALALTLCIFAFVLRGVQSRMRTARLAAGRPAPAAARYKPMLRLLNEECIAGSNTRAFRARRRAIFRKYLRCLSRDYSQLLEGLRAAMVTSGVDRPDLAKALAKNRVLFIRTMFRIEIGLAAHAAGIDLIQMPDLSGVIAGIDALRAQMPVFEAGFAGAR